MFMPEVRITFRLSVLRVNTRLLGIMRVVLAVCSLVVGKLIVSAPFQAFQNFQSSLTDKLGIFENRF